MKIDSIDGTITCEENDMQIALGFFKDYRKMPVYLEKTILKYIFKKLNIIFDFNKSIDESLKMLPESYIDNIIKDMGSMFKTNKSVNYSNLWEAYLLYYLPANLFKVWKPLLDLYIKNLLKPHIMILDVGTGPGSVPLGIIEFYKSLAVAYPETRYSVSCTLIEVEEEFLIAAKYLIDDVKKYLPVNLEVDLDACYNHEISSDYESSSLGKFDIVTMSNFLTPNEKNNQKQGDVIIKKFIENVNNSGALIIIEPGERKSCTSLKKIRNEVVGENGPNVYSPCVGIWNDKNKYDCSCFSMVRAYWDIPEIYKFLINKGLSKASRIDVPFNYLVLRKDGIRKYQIVKNNRCYTKLIDLNDKINEYVSIIAIIRTVIKTDKLFSISLCDGSGCIDEDNEAVWINLSQDELKESGINIPLIAAEKISLKKVKVLKKGKGFTLEFNKQSRLIVEY